MNFTDIKKLFDMHTDEVQHRHVIRLRTSFWRDKTGIHMKRSLITLRRKSSGYSVIEDDADMAGADKILSKITNLSECVDGIYEVVLCNISHDFETGYADDWDYELIPFTE